MKAMAIILIIPMLSYAADLNLINLMANGLIPKKESTTVVDESSLAVNLDKKRDIGISLYCSLKNNDTSIFCGNKNNVNMKKNVMVKSTDAVNDQINVVDNSVLTTYLSNGQTSDALEDKKTLEYKQNQFPNIGLPISPTNDVRVNVGQKEININIKY